LHKSDPALTSFWAVFHPDSCVTFHAELGAAVIGGVFWSPEWDMGGQRDSG